jgi:hypothetical protein
VDCQLGDGFSHDDAAQLALCAINTLIDVTNFACNESYAALSKALLSKSHLDAKTAELIIGLVGLPKFEVDGPQVDSEWSLNRAIAAICKVDEAGVYAWTRNDGCDVRQTIEGTWSSRTPGCMKPRCGDVHSVWPAEMRASGEWDALLALALSASGTTSGEPSTAPDGDLVLSERYRGVHRAALNALIPAAALLRFGLQGGGRQPHPLKSQDASVARFDITSFVSQDSTRLDLPTKTLDIISRSLGAISFSLDGVVDAIAVSLVDNMRSFTVVQGASVVRTIFVLLNALQDISQTLHSTETTIAFQFVSMYLARLLPPDSLFDLELWRSCLRASIFFDGDDKVPVIGFGGVSISAVLSYVSSGISHTRPRREFLKGLLASLWSDFDYLLPASRTIILRSLCLAIGLDNITSSGPKVIIDAIADSVNSCSEASLKAVIDRDVFPAGDTSREMVGTTRMYCAVLAVVLSSESFTRPHLVLEWLLDAFGRIRRSDDGRVDDWRKEVLVLACLYSCRCNALDTLASNLVNGAQKADDIVGLGYVETLSLFLHHLRTVLAISQPSKSSIDNATGKISATDPSAPMPQVCSYSNASAFTNQHWYHCYTCGLTEDKGW